MAGPEVSATSPVVSAGRASEELLLASWTVTGANEVTQTMRARGMISARRIMSLLAAIRAEFCVCLDLRLRVPEAIFEDLCFLSWEKDLEIMDIKYIQFRTCGQAEKFARV